MESVIETVIEPVMDAKARRKAYAAMWYQRNREALRQYGVDRYHNNLEREQAASRERARKRAADLRQLKKLAAANGLLPVP
jgi:hypothetical protein